MIVEAISTLSERDRTVLRLVKIEERPYADCAEILGVNVPHLKVLVHRALSRLRRSVRAVAREASA